MTIYSHKNNWFLEISMRTRLFAAMVAAFAVLALSGSRVTAKPCVAPPATPEAIAQFKANPQASLTSNSDARTVESLVRELAGTDASLAIEFIRLAREMPPRIQTAIAAGLAQAAVACTTVDQGSGLMIQEAVASFPDGQFQASFAAVAGDLSTAATEAAGAAAAASVGSVVVTNPATGSKTSTNPGGGGIATNVPLTRAPASFTLNTGFNPPTSTGSSTTAASPVSATR
jgi:hypothetical protein